MSVWEHQTITASMRVVDPACFSLEPGTGKGGIPFAIGISFFTALGADQNKFPPVSRLLTVVQFHIADMFKTHLVKSFRFTT
jgi:hypothetical protein